MTTKTDGTGVVTWQAEYEAFGTHPNEVGSTLDRQKANTKEEDPTGLLNEGFRYRDLGSYSEFHPGDTQRKAPSVYCRAAQAL